MHKVTCHHSNKEEMRKSYSKQQEEEEEEWRDLALQVPQVAPKLLGLIAVVEDQTLKSLCLRSEVRQRRLQCENCRVEKRETTTHNHHITETVLTPKIPIRSPLIRNLSMLQLVG